MGLGLLYAYNRRKADTAEKGRPGRTSESVEVSESVEQVTDTAAFVKIKGKRHPILRESKNAEEREKQFLQYIKRKVLRRDNNDEVETANHIETYSDPLHYEYYVTIIKRLWNEFKQHPSKTFKEYKDWHQQEFLRLKSDLDDYVGLQSTL